VTVTEKTDDTLDWQWLKSLPVVTETTHLKHVRVDQPFVIKIDGRVSQCVMAMPEPESEDLDATAPGETY
jgi:hypothetical protein